MNFHFRLRHLPGAAGLTLSIAIAAALGILPAHGRPVRILSPDELTELADAVVNGKVTEVSLTPEHGQLHAGSNPGIPIRIAEARVRTLASSKGSVPEDFLLRFPAVDPDDRQLYVDGPMLPSVQKGERYRFYLKRKGASFTTVLDDDIDSGFTVHPLAKEESDTSAPLYKEEARLLATKYFRGFRPKPSIAACEGHFDGSSWSFEFFTRAPLSFPSFAYDADVTIDGARQVATQSWVGREPPRKGTELAKEDAKTPVRITLNGAFQQGSFRPPSGVITILYGEVHSTGKGTVSGLFASPAFEPHSGPLALEFPRKNVASIQRLAVPPNTR